MQTDDGERLQGFEKARLDDWDLDLDERRRHASVQSQQGGNHRHLMALHVDQSLLGDLRCHGAS